MDNSAVQVSSPRPRRTLAEMVQEAITVPIIQRLPQFKGKYFMRCITPGCGRLVGKDDIHSGTCLGHRLQVAHRIGFWEFIEILLGTIK